MPLKIKIKKKTAEVQPRKRKTRPPLELQMQRIDCDPFEQIVHISDVHIRPFQRHQEFEQVFKQFFSQVRDLKVKPLIVVTGDILDSKSNFKPETISVARRFFRMLGLLAPTLVIAGNHDMHEQNTNRLDSLTPMVMDTPNVYYLKRSGIYQLNDVHDNRYNFVVSSLYDKHFLSYEQVKLYLTEHDNYQPNSDRLIHLYHGSLIGAKTEQYTIEEGPSNSESDGTTRYRKLADFEGFDAVMLGDIHLQQNFKLNSGGVVSYAGSLVQQNYGEAIRGHGFLLWPAGLPVGAQPKLYEVYNECGFVTIKIKDNKVVEQPHTLPKKPFLRLDVENTPEVNLDKIVDSFIQEHNLEPNEISKRLIHQQITMESVPEEVIKRHDDAELIKEILISSECLDKLDPILDLHSHYLVNNERAYSLACWNPIALDFTNMFGYSGNVKHNIIIRDGTSSLSAPNHTGKTSLINTIIFSVFGKLPLNPGQSAKFDIVNNNQTGGRVAIVLRHGGNYYKISRTTKRRTAIRNYYNKELLTKLTSFDFATKFQRVAEPTSKQSPFETDIIEDLTESTPANTDKAISQLFGTMDDFMITNMINKESNRSIINMTNAERIKILTQLFNIKMYSDYQQLNKKELKCISEQIAEQNGQLKATTKFIQENKDVVENSQNIEEIKAQLDNLKQELVQGKDNQDTLQEDFTDLHGQLKEKEAEKRPISAEVIKLSLEQLNSQYNDVIEMWQGDGDICDPGVNINRLLTEQTGYKRQLTKLKSKLTNLPSQTDQDKVISQLKTFLENYDFGDIQLSEREQIVSELAVCKTRLNQLRKNINGRTERNLTLIDDLPDKLEQIEPLIEQASEKLSIAQQESSYHIANTPTELSEQLQQVEEQLASLTSNGLTQPVAILSHFNQSVTKLDNVSPKIQYGLSASAYKQHHKALTVLAADGNSLQELAEISAQYESIKEQYEQAIKHTEHNKTLQQQRNKAQLKLDQLNHQHMAITVLSAKKELEQLEEEYEDLFLQRQYLDLLLQKEQIEQQVKDHNEISKEIADCQSKIDEIDTLIEQQNLFDQIVELSDKIELQEQNQEDIDYNNKIEQELVNLRKEYRRTRSDLEQIKVANEELVRNISNLERTISRTETLADQLKEMLKNQQNIEEQLALLQTKQELLQLYDNVVGKKGVQARILYFKTKAIEKYINQIISKFTKYQIELVYENDKNTFSFITRNNETDKYLSAERLCGYEKVILDIAVKRALNKYSANSKSSIIIIDEGFDVLDEEKFAGNSGGSQLSNLTNILLEDYKQALIVSQRNLDHIADHQIKIYRDNDGCPRISQT